MPLIVREDIDSFLVILLLRRIKDAVPEMIDHTDRHVEFTKGLPPEDVRKWIKELDAWEQDHTLPDPFRSRSKGSLTILCFKNPNKLIEIQ